MGDHISAQALAVADSWAKHNTDSVSTERLLQIVADDCGLDDSSEVVDLLIEAGVLKRCADV